MVAFEPVAWNPPAAPGLVGPFEENDRLQTADRWQTGGIGPEDVAIDANGAVFTGLVDGTILRFASDGGGRPERIASVGGRPLGLEILDDGELLVCNADLGLQRVTVGGEVSVLADRFEDERLTLTNNASVAGDGTIYFTESSTRWSLHEYTNDLLEGQTTGRLLARRPDGSVELVFDGLQFANGVALDGDEASVFVAETGRYRIHRHWLRGPEAGTTGVFVDNLPGFPDNLSFAGGILWMAAPSPRQAVVDLIHPRPWLRRVTYRLPESLKPKPLRHAIVLGFDLDGRVVHNLQDSTGTVAITTAARYHDGRLFIGTLTEPTLAVHQL